MREKTYTLTIKQAAIAFNCNEATLSSWSKKGRITRELASDGKYRYSKEEALEMKRGPRGRKNTTPDCADMISANELIWRLLVIVQKCIGFFMSVNQFDMARAAVDAAEAAELFVASHTEARRHGEDGRAE